jgi:hypothetical protein
MIACVSPLPTHYEETMNTLKYARRTRSITTLVAKETVRTSTTATSAARAKPSTAVSLAVDMSGLPLPSASGLPDPRNAGMPSLSALKLRLRLRLLQSMLNMAPPELAPTLREHLGQVETSLSSPSVMQEGAATLPELVEFLTYQGKVVL